MRCPALDSGAVNDTEICVVGKNIRRRMRFGISPRILLKHRRRSKHLEGRTRLVHVRYQHIFGACHKLADIVPRQIV